MKTTSISKRIVSILCAITLLMSMASVFAINTSAASIKQTYDCDRTVTFTVKTGSKSPSIKLVSTVAPKVNGHQCSRAPVMAITVSPAINGESFFLISGGCYKSISSTLRLKKNTAYTVKISYYVHKRNICTHENATYVNVHDLSKDARYRGFYGRDNYVNGSWYFSKITNCTVSNVKVK